MLAEARARLVDVETGEKPAALRPPAVDPPTGDLGRRPPVAAKADAAPRSRQPAQNVAEQPRDVPAQAPRVKTGATTPPDVDAAAVGVDGLLSLEDSPGHRAAPDEGEPHPTPWRRGLRG